MVSEIIAVAVGYLGTFIFAFIIFSFIMRGFFWNFLRAKLSGGRLVLVKIRGLIKPQYKTGRISEGDLVYRSPSTKSELRINNIPRESVYKDMGVYFVEVDEQKNCVLSPTFESVEGFDAEKMNSLYLRALYRPSILDQKTQILLFIAGGTALVSVISLIIVFSMMNNIDVIGQDVIRIGNILLQNQTNVIQ